MGFNALYEAADGTIWAGFTRGLSERRQPVAQGGLRRFDGSAWKVASLPGDTVDISAITETADNALWVGMGGNFPR